MIDFSTIEPALKALFALLSSDVPSSRLPVRLEEDPEEALSDVLRAEITIGRGKFRTLGTDERRASYDEDTDDMGDTIVSLRQGSFRIKCTSLEQGSPESAWHVLERIRTRLSRRSSGEALRAVGLAMIETSETLDLSRTIDKRQGSIAAFDLFVRTLVNEADPNRYPYIETIELGTKLDGKTYPSIIITGEIEP